MTIKPYIIVSKFKSVCWHTHMAKTCHVGKLRKQMSRENNRSRHFKQFRPGANDDRKMHQINIWIIAWTRTNSEIERDQVNNAKRAAISCCQYFRIQIGPCCCATSRKILQAQIRCQKNDHHHHHHHHDSAKLDATVVSRKLLRPVCQHSFKHSCSYLVTMLDRTQNPFEYSLGL